MSTLINCDPWKYMPDDSLMESGKHVRSSGDRVAMCQHSTVDAANCLAVEMSYAWVLLDDCWRLEATTRETMQRNKVGSARQEYPGPRHLDADADDPKFVCIAHDQHDIPRGFGPEWIKLHYGLKFRTSFDLSQIEWQAPPTSWTGPLSGVRYRVELQEQFCIRGIGSIRPKSSKWLNRRFSLQMTSLITSRNFWMKSSLL